MKTNQQSQPNSPATGASAFAPGHITGFFEIDDSDPDPLQRGSRGAGFSLLAGVVTSVHRDRSAAPECTISLNGEVNNAAPVSRRVVELFYQATGLTPGALTIEHLISVPEGAGFGSSGAGALSLALALDAAHGSPIGEVEAARLAHRAEIDCRTGLGTVLGSTVGGLEIRTRAGAPGTGEVVSFPVNAGLIVFCVVFGPLSTAAALADPKVRSHINALTRALLDAPTVPRFLALSREFSEKTGLGTPRLRRLLGECDRRGITAAMTMFGEALFTIATENQRPLLSEIAICAEAEGASIFESAVSPDGGKVIHAE
jgi:pantoate kinase